ncbi:MAG: hypothetical protein WDA47_03770 [Bacilli bacterium]
MADKKADKVVTVKDLAEEFEMEPREIRVILRSNGMKAPEVEREGFGPKSKYEWPEGSKELTEVRKVLEEALDEGDTEEDKKEPEEKEVKKESTSTKKGGSKKKKK